jgi:hypothetical protein
MAFFTVGWIARFEGFFAVMANAAILAGIHICHGNRYRPLHLKDLCVAIRAFGTFVGMNFAVKDYLASRSSCEVNCLTWTNSE